MCGGVSSLKTGRHGPIHVIAAMQEYYWCKPWSQVENNNLIGLL